MLSSTLSSPLVITFIVGKGGGHGLPPDGMLGVLLCYLGSQMSNKWLCLILELLHLHAHAS